MNVFRIGVWCLVIGGAATAAQAQLGTYGAPDSISWSQDALPAGQTPMVATRTTFVSTDDGSATVQDLPSQGSSGLAPMLSEPGPAVKPATGDNSTSVMPQGGYMQNAGNCQECGDCGMGCCGCGDGWYSTVYALWMTRNRPNNVWTSAEAGALVNQGSFTDVGSNWGGQVTVGHRFGCCGEWALEGTYWGMEEADSDGGPGIPGPYVSPMVFGLTDILGTTGGTGAGGAQQANSWTDNSPDHHIWRAWDAQNLELNLIRNICGGQSRLASVDFLVGVRWLRFQDNFIFGAERNPTDGSAYAGDWLYLNDHVDNDLVGLQAGFNASYRFAECWKAFITPKFGLYDNHVSLDYNLYAVSSTTGQQYQASSQTYANPNYPVHASSDSFSVMTQVDAGLDWQLTQRFSVQGGYRVLAATGIALSDNQIPFFANDTQSIANISRNGELVIGAAFVGGTFEW